MGTDVRHNIAIFASMESKRLITLLCAFAYLVAFAHSAIPHEYHVHESLATCCHVEHDCEDGNHHHHHLPHHSCNQLSSIYLMSQTDDDGIMPLDLQPMIAVIVTMEIAEREIPIRFSCSDSAPAPPPDPYLACAGFRAPPFA